MAKNMNILIVEDEAILAMHLKNDLLQMGHNVTAIYDSGENAIERAKITELFCSEFVQSDFSTFEIAIH